MTQSQAAFFKFSERTIGRARRVTDSAVAERLFVNQQGEYLFSVALPVGGNMNVPALLELGDQPLYQPDLYQAAFVVARLMPRVWKEYVYTV